MANPVIATNTLGFRREITQPRTRVPAGSCDSHMHIVGPQSKYPFAPVRSLSPPEASWQDYRRTASKLGLDRCVVVTPSFYGTDNRCTLDAVDGSGGRARAVVVVSPDVSSEEIARMHARGARGVRVQVISKGGIDFSTMEAVAERIAPFGWHLQLYLDAENLPPMLDRLHRLPVAVVFDHMAHVNQSNGTDGPGFRALLSLLDGARAWVKLSNALFPPSSARAAILARANPDRVLWGSDWPHVAHSDAGVPDDGALVDELAAWIPDEAARAKALVTNPATLYFAD
ncbi:MAG TPA: amidohydrolase family protein [Casimicrobiaceae bacterium]|nr:amidohydrolase family protein [Casimicrobiaceae bacterium]